MHGDLTEIRLPSDGDLRDDAQPARRLRRRLAGEPLRACAYRVNLKVTVVRGLPLRTTTAWAARGPLGLPVLITVALT